ncbi:MAG: CDP-glucose 4,6-dehydratase [Kiritimatiellaeota bacterium]|nr:CDP-glucose 4,6-dehydratase [Kiritimatiellota bacterium]
MFADQYRNRRVLVTGHTGFKGAWLSLWLKEELEAEVIGFSLAPPTEPNLFSLISGNTFVREYRADVRSLDALTTALRQSAPEIIFHMAAQALVRRSYQDPMETFTTNALGTANLLEAVRTLQLPATVIVVTSDKCYENQEWFHGYRETDPLGGRDVYSMSKAAAELVASAWARSFFARNPQLGHVATARAGNVLGGGDFAEDRILPDCYRALAAGRPIEIRCPDSVRPWQHVLDCLSGYLWLGARLAMEPSLAPGAAAFNFGPSGHSHRSVRELVEAVLKQWPGTLKIAGAGEETPEAGLLSLDTGKAAALLGWQPTWDFEQTVRYTVDWYRRYHAAPSASTVRDLCIEQIATFQENGRRCRAAWSS